MSPAPKKDAKSTNVQTPPHTICSGLFPHNFFCLTDDSLSLLFPRFLALVAMFGKVSHACSRWPSGFFPRRIFFSGMVELFLSSFSYQNTDREPSANRRITYLLSCRQSSETTRSNSSFAPSNGCFPLHDVCTIDHQLSPDSPRL